MKNARTIAIIACICAITYTSEVSAGQSDRKDARMYKKENRKARRDEYRYHTFGTENSDSKRIMRQERKQHKKMDKAARKENRRHWDTNELGDVYHIN